jgi:DNA polymerase (family X)
VEKKEIAKILEEIATLLELKEENPFRIRAYRNGARAVLNMDEDLKKVVLEGRLTEFEGIGDHLAEKITTLVKTGHLPYYEKLKKSIPPGLLHLMQIQTLGPKKVKALYKKLKIKSVKDLKTAAQKGKIAKLKGFGAKGEQKILEALEHRETYQKRHLWWDAMAMAEPIVEGLKKIKGVKKVEVAGSLRRKLETVGDLDFLVATTDPKPVMAWFTSNSLATRVIAKGDTKASVQLKSGIMADLRIVPANQFAYALVYFTGSKEHNIKIRERSLKRGWSLSEYGFEPEKKNLKAPLAKTEADIYKALGLQYIPPELREDRGEIEVAEKKKIPHLIEESDIRGTLHNHTTASDGKSTLKEMVAAAEKMGWEYIGISDHSKSSFQANGQSKEQLLKQVEEIRKLNGSHQTKIHIFSGLECDILADGTLDFPNSVLKKLDYVIASVHSSLQQDEKTMTKRIIRAIEHPLTTVLGHISGRLLLKREPYKVNIPKIIDACIANKKIIELNGNPMRLDMDWRFWRAAARKGLLCCINTDAHAADQHQFFRAGVNVARKGWLESKNVINTLPLKQLEKFLLQKRRS